MVQNSEPRERIIYEQSPFGHRKIQFLFVCLLEKHDFIHSFVRSFVHIPIPMIEQTNFQDKCLELNNFDYFFELQFTQ